MLPQRVHSKLQKSLLAAQKAESAAAKAEASAAEAPDGGGGVSAETKMHQKQNIERRVRLLEQTVRSRRVWAPPGTRRRLSAAHGFVCVALHCVQVDSANEEYERFRKELDAKTSDVDEDYKTRGQKMHESFRHSMRRIKDAFNHNVVRTPLRCAYVHISPRCPALLFVRATFLALLAAHFLAWQARVFAAHSGDGAGARAPTAPSPTPLRPAPRADRLHDGDGEAHTQQRGAAADGAQTGASEGATAAPVPHHGDAPSGAGGDVAAGATPAAHAGGSASTSGGNEENPSRATPLTFGSGAALPVPSTGGVTSQGGNPAVVAVDTSTGAADALPPFPVVPDATVSPGAPAIDSAADGGIAHAEGGDASNGSFTGHGSTNVADVSVAPPAAAAAPEQPRATSLAAVVQGATNTAAGASPPASGGSTRQAWTLGDAHTQHARHPGAAGVPAGAPSVAGSVHCDAPDNTGPVAAVTSAVAARGASQGPGGSMFSAPNGGAALGHAMLLPASSHPSSDSLAGSVPSVHAYAPDRGHGVAAGSTNQGVRTGVALAAGATGDTGTNTRGAHASVVASATGSAAAGVVAHILEDAAPGHSIDNDGSVYSGGGDRDSSADEGVDMDIDGDDEVALLRS